MDDELVIRSKDNRRLIYARSVRDGRESDLIFIEGKRQCLEAVRAKVEIELCLLAESFDDRETVAVLSSSAASTVVVADRLFQGVAETKTPQGIIAIVRRPNGSPEQLLRSLSSASIPVIVFLYEVNNPANLGGILRTVEAAGAGGVITSTGSTDAFAPKSNRSALGANLRIPIWEKIETTEVLEFARQNSLQIAAAVVGNAVEYTSVEWKRPTLLMLGSEAHGLSRELVDYADLKISIPLMNDVESLNLSVSCGIVLFEALRQHRMV